MNTLVVGEEPCTIAKVAEIMGKSSILQTNWSTLARKLGVPEVDIDKLRHDFLQLDKISLEDLLVKLLLKWKGRSGVDANMDVLCKALTDCDSTDIADKLDDEFAELVNAQILANGDVSVQGHVIKISDIFNTTASFPPGFAKQFRNDNPIKILKDFQIPNRPSYYIQRTVSPRTRINTKVFNSNSSDVFVLENLDWSNLDDKLFGSSVEQSSRQTVHVTAKIILLDFEKDYERICQVVPSNIPVHLVRFDSGIYYWVRSRGSLELIQQHVSSEQQEWSEQEFMEYNLSKFQNSPVCIADIPGMGKSLLLASIAQRVKESCPDRIVLFLVLRELGQSSNAQGGAMNKTADLFWKQITTSDFAVEALKRLIEYEKFQFELFLDGFDEVLPAQFDYVNQLLLTLKQQQNVRIHVTTRLHMRNQLEETLGVLVYNILPFTQDNQVDFLTRFWENCEESRSEELDDARLKSFANQCLEMLKKNMNKLERDIARIPLQCFMLADVFAHDAVKFSIKQSKTVFELTCMIESIFHIFQLFVKKKRDRVDALGKVKKQQLFLAHVHEAIKLIFPSWVDKLTCIQILPAWRRLVAKLKINFVAPQSGYSDSFLGSLYAVGLMEPNSSDAGAHPRFVHRTFAEFLIAKHLVKHRRCKPCSRLLGDAVLGIRARDSRIEFMFASFIDTSESYYIYGYDVLQVKSFEFRHNIIAYFVNALLGAVGSDVQAASVRSIQDVNEMLTACCLNNYASIFKGLSKVVLRGQVDSKAWTDLVLLVARYSEPNLMKKLVQLIQRMGGKQLSELEFPKERFGFKITPLHVAVQRGSYVMTRYFVNKIYTSLESLPYLLHSCVYQSTKNSDAIVKDKIEIIRLLIGRRKEVVHERLPGCNSTPLFLPNVHVDLIQALVEQGADINAVDNRGNTVLHVLFKHGKEFQPITPAGYTKVFNLLRANKFNLWDKKGNNNETSLYLAVKSVEVEHSVLDQYSHLNVDFNHVVINKYGYEYSVLFSAIREDRTPCFIKKLEQLRADINYVNSRGESALHIAAERGNYDVARYLVTERNFDVNHRDCNRLTPLHVALLFAFPNHIKIQMLLIENGAEFEDPEYKWRPTPLYYALSRGNELSLYIVKKMVAKGLGSEHLALALDLLVKNKNMKFKGKGSEYSKLFRYFYEYGSRIQNAAKKLEQHKCEFVESIFAINDQLLEQLKVAAADEVVLNGIRSPTDLYERLICGKIKLECMMLALLECNQFETFEAIRELLRYKNPKFLHALPGVQEFINAGNQIIVVAALDLELCSERLIDTIDEVEEYQKGVQLLPGSLCFVKVHLQEQNFREYLDGLTQLPYRFIVVCEKSLAAVVKRTYQVIRDHIQWDDLTQEYQIELTEVDCIGFQLSQESKEKLFKILRDESLIELMRNGRVSTDDFGRIIQNLVDQLDEQELKVLEEYCFKRLFPSELADVMNADSDYDEDKTRELIQSIYDSQSDKEESVGWFIAVRAVLNARFNDQQQMQEVLAFVFEFEEVQDLPSNDEAKGNWNYYRDVKKYFYFKNELLVYFMDWLVGRGYNFSFDFQIDWLDKYVCACLRSNAVNLTIHLFSMPNKRVYSIPGLLHRLVYKTELLDASQLELRVNLVLNTITENPGKVNSPRQDNLPPLLLPQIHVELIDLLIYARANVRAVNEQGHNFVHLAAALLPSQQFQQLVRYLVDHRVTKF